MNRDRIYSDEEYMGILNELISESEGKMQKAIKENKPGKQIETIRLVLNYLREKKKELADSVQTEERTRKNVQ